MSQSIPTSYILPGFFKQSHAGHPDQTFCLMTHPRANTDGQTPGSGEKLSQALKNCS